jgi:hypothetical protein
MPAWSYSGNPASSALDEVRYLIGDTDQTKPWSLSDAEIAYAIGLYSAHPPVIGDNFMAAAVSAETILTKLKGTLAEKTVGDLSLRFNDRTMQFFEAAAYRLRQRASLHAVPPYLGGYSHSEKRGQDSIADRVQLAVKIDSMNKTSGETENNDE